MGCSNKTQRYLTPDISDNGINIRRMLPSSYYDGGACVAFCPAETVKYCTSAFKDNFAKKQSKDKLVGFIKLAISSVIEQAANKVTEKSYKKGTEQLFLTTDPARIAQIQAAKVENIGKAERAVQALRGK
ncbi:MAG: hypothetical protein K2W94_05285 [Alphaproteobacteria bacterium]|nr:hypothetical protein [Alphaproteobacteria bacterium]